MTVTEFMNEYGITRTNFYRALKAHNINADDLREPESKHLSVSGLQTLAAILGDGMKVQSEDAAPDAQNDPQTAASDTQEYSSADIELAVLRERVAALQRENELLRENTAKAEATAEDWRKRYDDSQRLLLSATAPKPTFFERLFGRRKGNS